jgi:hypothetical protein
MCPCWLLVQYNLYDIASVDEKKVLLASSRLLFQPLRKAAGHADTIDSVVWFVGDHGQLAIGVELLKPLPGGIQQ